MSAVLIDLDKFGFINENFGALLGDRILHQVGQILKAAVGEADLVGRYAGERFLAVLVDIGPRGALKSIELMRQTIDKTTFLHEAERIKATVGCAVAEVKPEDKYMDVLERLEKMMKIVKEAGHNRTFQYIDRSAEPVESPSFGAAENEIVI